MPQPASINTLQNEWIYGPTGVGKSRSVRDSHPVHYPKARNKWWDGYKGEEVIVIDEVSPADAEWIAPMLKVWADHYPFIAEMKGRSVQIRPKHVIVTSNYSMEEIFKDPGDLEPMKRRFKQIHMIGYNPNLNSFS